MSDIQALMRSANPIPDTRTEFGQDDLDALLLLTQQRSGDMDAKELTRPVEEPPRRRSGWLVAAAVFVGVVLIAGLVAVAGNRNPIEPADQPTPTTQALPSTTAVPSGTSSTTTVPSVTNEQVEVIASFEAAFNRGDEAAMRATLDEGARITDRWSELAVDQDVDWIVGWMTHLYAQETTMFIDEDACRVVGERVFCEVIISGVVHETMIGTDAQVSHLYLIEDGRILSIEETTVVVGDPDDAYAVRHFARAESPEEADTMTAAIYGPGSAESGRLWLKWAVLWDEAGRPPRSGG